MVKEIISCGDLAFSIREKIGALAKIDHENPDDLRRLNTDMNRFFSSLSDKKVKAQSDEVRELNQLFGSLHRVGNYKARRFKLKYSAPTIILEKDDKKSANIRVFDSEMRPARKGIMKTGKKSRNSSGFIGFGTILGVRK